MEGVVQMLRFEYKLTDPTDKEKYGKEYVKIIDFKHHEFSSVYIFQRGPMRRVPDRLQ